VSIGGTIQKVLADFTELEASLTLKVQEVDEADDRVKEVYKEKVKLEKKVAKLQRQLVSATSTANAETAANTAANKHIPAPAAMEMPPPPVPKMVTSTPKAAGLGKIPASPRQPLRPVAVLAEKALSPGLKRAREERLDEKPQAVEMILLPPSQLDQPVKTTPRSAVKPLRKAFGEVAMGRDRVEGRERLNVFSEH
jgi:hypothetical protein